MMHWICPKCGFTLDLREREFPIHCHCGHAETYHQAIARQSDDPKLLAMTAYLNCPHRGPVLTEINARTAGCGCASSTVDVYHCRHFHEPVLRSAPARCVEAIREQVPNYTGRTCRACSVPGSD
jgi:DNA-directed RNA polymerase subunit RPC12/RpoP